MKRFMMFLGVLIVTLFMVPTAIACKFDTDCAVGSRCQKLNALDGVCVGGMRPGNDNDRKPKEWIDFNKPGNKKTGNTCSFDTDCGVGGRCAKEQGQLKGACL